MNIMVDFDGGMRCSIVEVVAAVGLVNVRTVDFGTAAADVRLSGIAVAGGGLVYGSGTGAAAATMGADADERLVIVRRCRICCKALFGAAAFVAAFGGSSIEDDAAVAVVGLGFESTLASGTGVDCEATDPFSDAHATFAAASNGFFAWVAALGLVSAGLAARSDRCSILTSILSLEQFSSVVMAAGCGCCIRFCTTDGSSLHAAISCDVHFFSGRGAVIGVAIVGAFLATGAMVAT